VLSARQGLVQAAGGRATLTRASQPASQTEQLQRQLAPSLSAASRTTTTTTTITTTIDAASNQTPVRPPRPSVSASAIVIPINPLPFTGPPAAAAMDHRPQAWGRVRQLPIRRIKSIPMPASPAANLSVFFAPDSPEMTSTALTTPRSCSPTTAPSRPPSSPSLPARR